jgi:hypothetical protein
VIWNPNLDLTANVRLLCRTECTRRD